MRVVIADDEPLARELLRALLLAAGVEVVGEADSGPEALELIAAHAPDAAFLDIDMPQGDGITAAARLAQSTDIPLVFVTAHEPYAVDAFELGAADYLLKPVRRARLATALERVRTRLGRARPAAEPPREAVIWVSTRSGRRRLAASEILWIEAQGDHVLFHTPERSFLHRITMDQVERDFAAAGLVRVHRSSIVRTAAVRAVERRGKRAVLRLEGGACVTVGASYRDRLRGLLSAPPS